MVYIVIGKQQIIKGLLKSEFLKVVNPTYTGLSKEDSWKAYQKTK